MRKSRLLFAAVLQLVLLVGSVAEERLNVLMIAVDDLRPELNCYGAEHIHSPNIDQLAAEGLLFERAYCQIAVCGASRTSLLSGTRPETTTVWDYQTPMRSKLPDVRSLPQHFKENGYVTLSYGKVYHASTDDYPQGWSEKPFKPSGPSYVTESARKISEETVDSRGRNRGPSVENGGDVPDSAYGDGKVAAMVAKRLGELASTDQPFFVACGFTKPHLPFNAPGKYWYLYDRDTIKVPSRDQIENSPLWARSGWGELRNYADIGREPNLSDEQTLELIHGYYASVSYMDANVGTVLRALEENGLKENTIVILWGDHGWYLGEYGDWCKHTNDELAAHVPMILNVPGVTAGQRSSALVEFVDIYPTLSELAGLEVPEHCQGHSMVPLLEDPNRAWKEAAFSQYRKSDGSRKLNFTGTSIRTERWRYTEWRNRENGELDTIELYDLKNDPAQTISVHGNPEHARLIEVLSEVAAQSATGVEPPVM